jgi:UDP-N-acetylmuramoyl-tripeptide--D-alanyl-D-alanine ligase
MKDIEALYSRYLKHPKITTDSRNIKPGSIFFALKGANFNGNKFAAEALKKGAVFAVIDEKEYAVSEKTILVDDVLKTLQTLAKHHRNQLDIPILGITGTNGKTTTKELISAVLEKKYNLSFTQGNFNNHIGVPLTLLRMNKQTQFGVVEMGANHIGEIAELCQIANPNYGIITNVGKAHLEGFGSFEGVKTAKGELYKFIEKNGGTIFLNADNNILRSLAIGIKNKITFGTSEASFTGEAIESPPFVHVRVNFPKGVLYLNSNLTGGYNFENIMAAACIGNYFGVDPLQIQDAIKNYTPTNSRSQLLTKNKLTIWLDAYNANPTSMAASIKSFLSNKVDEKYLILGDMLEMGQYSDEEHTKILELITNKNVDTIFLVGAEFAKANSKFGFHSFLHIDELCSYLSENLIKNGNILIKGSRGIQLEKVLDFLN